MGLDAVGVLGLELDFCLDFDFDFGVGVEVSRTRLPGVLGPGMVLFGFRLCDGGWDWEREGG